jgi:3-deoxy-D-manno-octulosonate 8-phosphate phosphatase (KDO 8-P phosphatase)
MRDLRQQAISFKEKLSKIKVFACDVDGILTDGRIFYQDHTIGFNRYFHAHDGYGLKILQKAGIKVGVISGGTSVGLVQRVDNLKLDFSFLGNEDKRQAYLEIMSWGHKDEEILYMGDEFFDLPLLERCGFSATVPSSSYEIQEAVDYVTGKESGQGAVREVVDLVRYAQGIIPEIQGF